MDVGRSAQTARNLGFEGCPSPKSSIHLLPECIWDEPKGFGFDRRRETEGGEEAGGTKRARRGELDERIGQSSLFTIPSSCLTE